MRALTLVPLLAAAACGPIESTLTFEDTEPGMPATVSASANLAALAEVEFMEPEGATFSEIALVVVGTIQAIRLNGDGPTLLLDRTDVTPSEPLFSVPAQDVGTLTPITVPLTPRCAAGVCVAEAELTWSVLGEGEVDLTWEVTAEATSELDSLVGDASQAGQLELTLTAL